MPHDKSLAPTCTPRSSYGEPAGLFVGRSVFRAFSVGLTARQPPMIIECPASVKLVSRPLGGLPYAWYYNETIAPAPLMDRHRLSPTRRVPVRARLGMG